MAILVEWFSQENQILLMRYQGKWTWEQHYSAVATCKVLMEESPVDRVDVIATLEDQFFPSGTNISSHALHSIQFPINNLGLIVIVANNRLISGVLSFALRATRRTRLHYRATTSLKDAEDIIARSRADTSTQL